jgi:hypothetical protein
MDFLKHLLVTVKFEEGQFLGLLRKWASDDYFNLPHF